jgi:TolA-binding protein
VAIFHRTLPQLRNQRRELERRDEEIRAQIAALERQIAEAPGRVAEKLEQRIEAIHAQAEVERSLLDRYSSLSDKRFLDAPADNRPPRRMRMHTNAERRAFIWRCAILLAILAILLVWLRVALN